VVLVKNSRDNLCLGQLPPSLHQSPTTATLP
jgi:hypothetical protein